MNIELKSTNYWNELDKEDEVDTPAVEGDVVAVIDGVVFLVERTNNCNNIVCTLLDKDKHAISSIRAMFKLCVWLYEELDIKYVRVEGSPKRYRFLEKIFPLEVVVRNPDINDRNVYYCNIERGHDKLVELCSH